MKEIDIICQNGNKAYRIDAEELALLHVNGKYHTVHDGYSVSLSAAKPHPIIGSGMILVGEMHSSKDGWHQLLVNKEDWLKLKNGEVALPEAYVAESQVDVRSEYVAGDEVMGMRMEVNGKREGFFDRFNLRSEAL